MIYLEERKTDFFIALGNSEKENLDRKESVRFSV